MNNPNPILQRGSLLDRRTSKGKSNLLIAVFTILAIHVVLFGGLLMQGCKREKPQQIAKEATNAVPVGPDLFTITNLPPPSTYLADTSTFAPPATNIMRPPSPTRPPPPPAPETVEYTVVRGDSFYKIAKDHGVSLSVLTQANPNVDPRKLQVGQKVVVPMVKEAAPGPGQMAGPDDKNVYVVKAGDTLTKIAREHSTTVNDLRALNELRTDRLLVGQKLKLPAAEPARRTSSAPPITNL